MPPLRFRLPFALVAIVAIALSSTDLTAGGGGSTAPRWWKGNLHTHSLWSDGDDYPEMIADWYKQKGYDFLALSDHNVLQEGQRWLELKAAVSIGGSVNLRGGGAVLEAYLRRFGPDWVEFRDTDGQRSVRLKPLSEYRSLLEEPGRFLLIPSEEVTSSWKRPKTETAPERSGPVHINVTNLRDHLAPVESERAADIMQRTLDAVRAQRQKTGQPMIAHINHPNFRWGITPEELMEVKGELFFEVYNGHPQVENDGNATHLSMDALWDAVLTRRIAELKLEPMFGVAVDDSHNYHSKEPAKSRPGRGWIMVRSHHLTAESIIRALEAGDFYASSGVTLSEVTRSGTQLSLAIQAEPGVTYRTVFLGTRKNYPQGSEELTPPADPTAPLRTLPHRRYPAEIGAVLAESSGTTASYTLRGDELYVRAKVISSKPKADGSTPGEFETAWTQPLLAARP
ncbi:MAG: hypothetical protein U1F61_15010 [Opitutaceae bacterium]